MNLHRGLVAAVTVGMIAAPALATAEPGGPAAAMPPLLPGGYQHLVVIYQENHSFDNLYGGWGDVAGEEVHGLQDANPGNWTQRAQDGTAYTCLLQNDPNLTSPPLGDECEDGHTVYSTTTGLPVSSGFRSHFANEPFTIDDYIQADDVTCPNPEPTGPRLLPGGCTRDLVHRFYQEQYAIDGGEQDRYVTASDAIGLTMGVYDTKQLPIYEYLHSPRAPRYVIADNFFQAAFGGSFLNHQWLIAARTPYDDPGRMVPENKLRTRFSRIDAAGMPVKTYPLYSSTGDPVDGELTVDCAEGIDTLEAAYEAACGRFAINTVQPSSPPYNDANPNARFMSLIDDDEFPNIGDRMSDAGISWAWYTGRWDDANAGLSVPLFQYHHQPFNYFEDYAPGQPGRAHLKDETEFRTAARNGTLPAVSFVKPYGAENEHPGYASEPDGSDHLVDLIRDVVEGDSAGNTLIVVTYDEFGGQWDHVSPPSGQPGSTDRWGPGTRIPALVIARNLKKSGVDHTQYDTTSILATIERSYGLEPLSSRDAAVNDLSHAVAVGGRKVDGFLGMAQR
jgi:acid phosphatase